MRLKLAVAVLVVTASTVVLIVSNGQKRETQGNTATSNRATSTSSAASGAGVSTGDSRRRSTIEPRMRWTEPEANPRLRAKHVIEDVAAAQGVPSMTSTDADEVPPSNAIKEATLPGPARSCSDSRVFEVYTLGEEFNGLLARSFGAECAGPSKVSRGLLVSPTRLNSTSVNYGACFKADSGCAPELQVQNYPSCERPHWLYHALAEPEQGPVPHRHGVIRGVPVAIFDSGRHVEVYTQTTTVSIFGSTADQVSKAVIRLRPMGETVSSEDLPYPDKSYSGSRVRDTPCS